MDHSIISNSAEDLRLSLQRLLPSMVNTSIPGIIDEFIIGDDGVPRVSARAAIRFSYINPDTREVKYLDCAKITNIPLAVTQCESLGLSMTAPIKHGQLCTLVFSQRSLDNFATVGTICNPDDSEEPEICTIRCFDYTDAMCFPGVMTQANNIVNYNQDAIEVRNSDASVKMAVYPEQLILKQDTATITLNGGNISAQAGEINLNADNITLTASEVNINGHKFTASSVELNAPTTINGTDFDTHLHSGVTVGSGNTGVVVK